MNQDTLILKLFHTNNLSLLWHCSGKQASHQTEVLSKKRLSLLKLHSNFHITTTKSEDLPDSQEHWMLASEILTSTCSWFCPQKLIKCGLCWKTILRYATRFLITSLADCLQAFRKGSEKTETVATPVTSQQRSFLVSTDAVGPCWFYRD